MSIYKQNGFLPFIKIDQYNDWQLEGYYYNAVRSLKNVPKDVLVGFRTPSISSGSALAPSTMVIRKISIVNNAVVVISIQTETSGLTKATETINGVTYSYYYRNQGAFSADPLDYLTEGCIYDIYIIDSQNNEYLSHPFLAISEITGVTKPIYKRNGFLPFYKSDQKQDWKLEGYYRNWVLSLKKISKTSLAGFRTPNVEASLTVPANMTIRRLQVVDDSVSVIENQVIVSGLIKTTEVINGVTYYYYYRPKQDMSIILTAGYIYDISITDGTNSFLSDIFLAINEADREYYLVTEDNEAVLTEDGETITIPL